MTTLGKILVFANSLVAVVLFGWALSIYTNRVDWFDRQDGETKIDGQFKILGDEVKRLSDQIKASQQAYVAASYRLASEEVRRDFRDAALQARLKGVKDSNDQSRFREQVKLPGGLIDLKAEGTVVNGLNGKPLKGLGTLNAEFKALAEKSLRHQRAIVKYRDEYSKLSDEVLLVQNELFRQKVIFDNLTDEQDYLSDARINWEEQLRTLELRKSQLLIRLESVGATQKVGKK